MKSAGLASNSSLNNPQTFTLGALGDSITRGMDIHALGLESPDESWSTGANLSSSIFNRVQAMAVPEMIVTAQNLAVSGQTVLGSSSQFSAKAQQLAMSSPDVVTVEIGANDVCQGFITDTARQNQMRDKMIAVLNTLVAGNGHTPRLIVVSSIPHIYALTQIPTFASSNVCQTAWTLMCPNLQIGQAQFEAQWAAANQALSDAATAVGGPVVFDGGAVANTVFTASDVSSLDCFHPSTQGQGKLAGVVWPFVLNALSN